MGWQNEMTMMVRALTNDLGTPQKNSDAYIQMALVSAGILVNLDVDLPYTYSFSVSGITISPDPIDSNDTMSQALFPLKAACILDTGNFQKAVGQGIRVRDGDSAIDTSVSFRGYRDILELGACAAYEKLKKHIVLNAGVGANVGAIISPHRNIDDNPVADIQLFYDSFVHAVGDSCRRQY